MSRFKEVIEQIRRERGLPHEVPDFDPSNGNEAARFLLVLEAPGPKALETGLVSLDNPDPSARNLKRQLDAAGVSRADLAIWNIVPWYISEETGKRIRRANRADVEEGAKYLPPILELMPNLRCIVLIGSAARSAHVFLSHTTTARILSCHHPSARAMNANPAAYAENVEVFRFMLATAGSRSQ